MAQTRCAEKASQSKNAGKPVDYMNKLLNFCQGVVLMLALSLPVGNTKAETTIYVPGLFNTGVNGAGVVLSQQSPEMHYSLSGAASIAYVVPPVYEPNLGWVWTPAPAGSAWIGPNSTTNTAPPDPVGLYHYRLEFDLTGYNPDDVRISGSWMTDNEGELFLNGVSTGFATDPESYKHLTPFSLYSGFTSGINTLEFRVLNESVGPNPSGLCVAALQATLVPEPGALAIAIGILVTAAARRAVRRETQNEVH